MGTRVRLFSSAMERVASDALSEKIDLALNAGVESAQRLVPIDTGELHDGIHIIEQTDTNGSYGVTDVEHAEPVEFGTSKMQAQPYLRPSIDAMEAALR
jgi:hypothetical protein